ncbi:MAG: hypothetical protein GMKNLPBB_03251 [Myxococcota bacterium]|nr:hypothetical protein [Myxococcota bacterium]
MKPFQLVSRLAARRPGVVTAVLLLSLIPALLLSSGLVFKNDFADLLPADTPAVKEMHEVMDRSGGSAYVIIAVSATDLPLAKKYALDLDAALTRLDPVLYVQSKMDLGFIRDRRLLYLPEKDLHDLVDRATAWIDKRTAAQIPGYVELEEDSGEEESINIDELTDQRFRDARLPRDEFLIGNDGKFLYVFIRLKGAVTDMDSSRQALADIRRAAEDLRDGVKYPLDLTLHFAGSVPIRIEEDEIMRRDLQSASLLGFVSVVLLITLYTRRLRSLVLLSLPLIISVAWTFAIARMAYGHLNIITGFLASILSGLGIESGIHLFLRYLEERGHGKDNEQATEETILTTGRSVFSGGLTNAGGFLVLCLASFAGYQEFGVLAGCGMLIVACVSILFVPSFNELLEKWLPVKIRPASDSHVNGIHLPRPLRTFIVALVPAFALFSVVQVMSGQVVMRTNWREIKGESPASDFDDYMIQSLGGSFTQTLVLMANPGEEKALKQAVEDTRRARMKQGLPSGVTRVVGIGDLVPPDQDKKMGLIEELRRQLDRVKPEALPDADQKLWREARELTNVSPFTHHDVPDSLKRRFEDSNRDPRMLVLFTRYMFYETEEVIAWADEMSEIRAALDKTRKEAHLLSDNWIAGTIFRVVAGDGPFVVLAGFVAVFLVLLLDFRSFRHAAIVITPLVLAVMCILGGMSLLGIQLNFINGIVLPCITGISVDNAIHIYHRYLQGGPSSVPQVLRHTASATFLASFTNMLGFGSMIIAHHKGLRSVGELAILGISIAYVCTSIFFPLALQALSRENPRPNHQTTPEEASLEESQAA